MRPRAVAAAAPAAPPSTTPSEEDVLRQRIRNLEAENEKMRKNGSGSERLSELETENFDLRAQLSTCEAEKDYEIEKGLERLAAELRFKNRELAARTRQHRPLHGGPTTTTSSSSQATTCDDHVLDAVFSHSQETLPSRTREAVARLGRTRTRENAVECLADAVRDDCYEFAYDLATAMLPDDSGSWTESLYCRVVAKVVEEESQSLGHFPLLAALAPFVEWKGRLSAVLCAGDETSLCFDLLVRGGTNADCVGDLLRHAADAESLETIETDIFPEIAKALDFASFEPTTSENAKRIFRTSLVVSSTIARRDADVALRLIAGAPFRALLQDANDQLEEQYKNVANYRDVFVKTGAPILHLLAHLLFYSTHPAPLKTLLLGLNDSPDSNSSSGTSVGVSEKNRTPPSPGAKLAKHELNALLDRLRYVRPDDLPPYHAMALDRDLESIDVRWTTRTSTSSTTTSSQAPPSSSTPLQ